MCGEHESDHETFWSDIEDCLTADGGVLVLLLARYTFYFDNSLETIRSIDPAIRIRDLHFTAITSSGIYDVFSLMLEDFMNLVYLKVAMGLHWPGMMIDGWASHHGHYVEFSVVHLAISSPFSGVLIYV
ncbi:hypothetical protein VTL71DRAFT_7130 [Oculimacula yallundae]|uniref:Uncharacterized protein n=1 Tax=Oculimacula yallundae TaxID=86028 RepID=A0ABR4BVV1_9HELO